jgi:small-conductance mechanosensitive channel
MAETDPAVEETAGSLYLGISIVTGLTLLRLGQLLRSEAKASIADQEGGVWGQAMRLLGQALIAIGVAGPIAIALGFVNLGLAVLTPAVATLALLIVIGVAQTVVFDIYALAKRRTDSVQDALGPTLVAFLLAVIAVPLLLLIWGVRAETLLEWWRTFLGGFSIGEFTLSPGNLLTFFLIFGFGVVAVRLIKGVLRSSVLPKTKLDSGGTNAILSGTSYVGITIAALIAVTMAGIDLTGLAFIAGALTVGLGFGLQNIVQNFVSGIILLIERPIKIGDWVEAGGVEGFVREISVRSTRIETFDRQDVIVPNADLIANVVTNNTLGDMSGRVVIQVGVAYGTDTRRVQKILQEIAEEHPMVILSPPPLVTFEGFGADSLDFVIRAVLRDVLWKVVVNSEINHAIAERFAREGIEIPFAQRDVWLRNPEALQSGAARTPEAT